MKRRPFIIFIVCYLAYTAIYIARLNFSMASPGLLAENLLSQEQVGMIGSVFFVVYALGRVVNGIIGDRTSPWIMISAGLLLGGIGNLLIGLNPTFMSILLLWGVNAYAQSMIWSSLIRIISEVYDYERAKKMMSYMVTSVATGNILGILLGTLIINRLGLRFVFLVPGGILFIMCLLIILVTRHVVCETVKTEHIPIRKLVLDHRIRTMIAPTVFHGMIKDNISLWMTIFFVDQYNIDLNASAAFVLFIPVVGFAGRLAYPFMNHLYGGKEERLVRHMFLLCTVASIALISKTVPPVVALVCLSLIYAAISIINTYLLTAVPLQFAASGNQSSVSGIMDLFTYSGAGIGSFVYGYLVSWFGYPAMFISYAFVSVVSLIVFKKQKASA